MNWYITLLLCGLFLIGVEIFVPGGVLGILGAAALIGAAVIGFSIFPPWLGWVSLFVILGLTGLAIFCWMKFFPTSPIGRALSLPQKLSKDDKKDSPWKPGMTGIALCELRPAGKASINEQRIDVIADNGTFVERDAAIEITRVSGNHVYVRGIEV